MKQKKKIKASELTPCFGLFCDESIPYSCFYCDECDRVIFVETFERAKKDGLICFNCGALYEIEDDKS